MDLVSSILAALLFAAFVPGVLVTIPKGGSRTTVLLVHALLFAFVTHWVMWYYWTVIRERFGNYGNWGPAGCPPCFLQNKDGVCKPDPKCSGPNSELPY
jgi:hypothetical protein